MIDQKLSTIFTIHKTDNNQINNLLQMFKKKPQKQKIIDVTEIDVVENEEEEGKPKKKVKKQVNLPLNYSTKQQKLQSESNNNKKFQEMKYKVKETDQSSQQEEIVLIDDETEIARKKYLQNIQSTKDIREGKVDSKIYRGQNFYANYQILDNQLQNPLEHYKKKYGPTRGNSNTMKNTCRFDYDRSLCKDWHDSGYCAFGNSCIYIHDRSNYKTGWEQQKDFEREERQRWKKINNPNVEEEEEIKNLEMFKVNEICQHCQKQYKNPVEVECHHIFCMKCAISLNNEKKTCPICKKKLGGIMNNAEKTIKQKKQQYEELVEMAKNNSKEIKQSYRNIDSIDVFKD